MTKARVWTQEEIEEMREVFRYDPESPSCLSRLFRGIRWQHVAVKPNSSRGELRVGYNGSLLLIHRVIWMLTNGVIPEGMEIDHIDGNPSNNKLDNLRMTTGLSNHSNLGRKSTNKSGVPNVQWHKQSSKWRVVVTYDCKKHHGGYFTDLESARVAAEALARKLKGSYYREGLHDKDEVRTDPTTLS